LKNFNNVDVTSLFIFVQREMYWSWSVWQVFLHLNSNLGVEFIYNFYARETISYSLYTRKGAGMSTLS